MTSPAKREAFHPSALQSVLMLSTGHLTGRTAQFLRDHDAADWPSPGGHFGDLGWLFWVDEGAGSSVPHLPHDLMNAFEYAAAQGASFIIFQDVSPVVPHLPTYNNSGAFEADAFLNRPKKTIGELDADAAFVSLQTLALDPEFSATPGYVALRMAAIMDDIAAYASNAQLSAIPFDNLQNLSDLAITYHFHAKRKPRGGDAWKADAEDFVARMDAILADSALASLRKHRRTREILENVQYCLRLTTKLFEPGSKCFQ